MASAFFANGTNGPNGVGARHGPNGHRHAHHGVGTNGFFRHSNGVDGIQASGNLHYGRPMGGASESSAPGVASGRPVSSTNAFANGGREGPNPFASRNHSPPSGFPNQGGSHSPPLGFPGGLRSAQSNGFPNGNHSPSAGGFGNVSLPPLHSFFQGTNGHGVHGVNGMNSVKTVAGMAEPTGVGSINRLKFLVEEVGKGVETLGAGNPKPIEDIAKLKLVTATQELLGTVRPPQDAIMGWFAYMGIVSAVHVFQDWLVFDAIPPTGMISYAELAEKVNAEEAVLLRMSWMLTSTSILRHHASGHIAHTPVSLLLRENEPMGSMFKVMYKNVVEVSVVLPAYFNAYGRKEPTGPNHLPSSFLEGQPELQYSQVLNQDPARRQVFMHAMSLNHRRVPTTGMYDITWVIEKARLDSTRPIWVDVGGGTGFTVKVFREVYPDLPAAQCVVQDLPEMIEEANKNPDPELKDVKFVPFDFHKDSPVQGALVYYLRHVLRESGDLVCINILKNIAAVMVEDSRILISEQITENPPPVFSAFKDYTMLSLGGKERTLENFNQIAEASGLRISGVFPDRGTPHAVIELALANAR